MSIEQYNELMRDNARMFFNERIYRDLDGKKITKHIAYKEMMIFSQLKERDMFGGRVMCTKSHQTGASQEGAEGQKSATQSHEPAQLSVLADSADVDVFVVDKAKMHLFPEAV